MRRVDRRGQVWIETVIYTLIGLAIIGIVLAGALPRINEHRDKIMIGQSINAMTVIDNKIYEVQRAPGNRRVISLDVRAGSLKIDMDRDRIYWVLESSYAYSEVGYTVAIDTLNVTTTEEGSGYIVELATDYNMDIRFEGDNFGVKEFTEAPIPYNIAIENDGKDGDTIVIEISEN